MTAIDLRTRQLDRTLAAFHASSVDCQLAVIWHIYHTLGQAVADATPVALFSQMVQRLISQFQQVSRPDRLEVLRDIVANHRTRFSDEYAGLNINMKLAFWHRLITLLDRQAIEALSETTDPAGQAIRRQLDTMGLNERLHFLRRVL